ncbi:MAG: DNA polymerase III subunit gamma/tau [Akkermansia sp.]|nr:DNA polymerase III subunit gamma/tau [Akkermansia sp.]
MSYQVFARKYRPQTFKDVLGQDHVVRTLCNAIEQKRLAHAYLFVGPRGTGKTSTARIFAKALNCPGGPKVDFDPTEDVCREIAEGRSLDVLEIDGASNRGIDNIRDLRDNVQFAPTRGQYRIIYIDEVHMLTKESFNALLKTLEEPPAHVMFIFATTEPHKILPTILSRCQRFDLRPIPAEIIANHLVNIAGNEGVTLEPAAAQAIARVADGGMRDAQSMLDQLVSFCGNSICEQDVNDIFGVTSRETVARALAYILDRQLPSLLHLIHELSEAGRDMGQLLSEIMGAVRELLILKVAPQEANFTVPEQWRDTLAKLLERTPSDKIVRLMEVLSGAEEHMRWSTNKRLHLEMGLIQAVHSLAEANISDIIRALNGAPLPETPIATTVLPPVPMPGTAAEPAPAAQPAPVQAPAPAPVEQPAPVEEPAPAPAPLPQAPAPGLEPIDDNPPAFAPAPPPAAADMPPAADMEPPMECMEPVMEDPFMEPELPAPQPMTPELWERLLERLRELSPLKAALIGHTLFISDDDALVRVAIHPQDTDTRDALYSEDISALVKEIAPTLCGRTVTLSLVTDDSIAPPAPPEAPPTPTLPEPPPQPKKEKKDPAAENKVPAPASLRPTEEEFYNDPLITLALDAFHATLVKQNAKTPDSV